mmetsp:Transcript_56507/g.101284  ORF Transcript_56507/g.101284 Transcript_56507/m.101284 type:complete len:202 (+) Transcript_56507:722-1327(+)
MYTLLSFYPCFMDGIDVTNLRFHPQKGCVQPVSSRDYFSPQSLQASLPLPRAQQLLINSQDFPLGDHCITLPLCRAARKCGLHSTKSPCITCLHPVLNLLQLALSKHQNSQGVLFTFGFLLRSALNVSFFCLMVLGSLLDVAELLKQISSVLPLLLLIQGYMLDVQTECLNFHLQLCNLPLQVICIVYVGLSGLVQFQFQA